MKITFWHKDRQVTLHHCDDVDEGKVRFQWRYGYWPTNPLKIEDDDPIEENNA